MCSFSAFSASSLLSRALPPKKLSGSRCPNTKLASVTVGYTPPLP